MATMNYVAPTRAREVEKLGPPKWTVIESFLLGARVERESEGCMCLLGLLSKLDPLVLACLCPKPKKKLIITKNKDPHHDKA
jgi:hypothetical protein